MDIRETSVLIAGASARGSYAAARLHELGADVTLLTRPSRAEQIVLRGLRITSPMGRFRRPVHAIVTTTGRAPVDVALLCCRAHMLIEALAEVAAVCGPKTVLLSVVDGGPHFDTLRRLLPQMRIIEGIFEGRLRIDVDGIVSHRLPAARLTLGKSSPDDSVTDAIACALNARGLLATASDNIARKIWARRIFLGAAIGASALARRPFCDAMRFVSGRSNFLDMLAEGRDIARANGIEVTKLQTWNYRHAIYLEDSPVAPPARTTDPGGAGLEAMHILTQLATQALPRSRFMAALEAAAEHTARNTHETFDAATQL